MTKTTWIVLISVAVALFLGLISIIIILACNSFAPLSVDKSVAQWAYDVRGEKGGFGYYFFVITTELGNIPFVIVLALVLALIWRFKPQTWFFYGGILLATLAQIIIKAIVMRPRPDEALQWVSESSSSFPSGHSTTVACVFVMLIYFVFISKNAKLWLKYLILTLSTLAIIIVPISRLILGVHYFTDILAGLCLGSLVALLAIFAYELYLSKFANRKLTPQKQTT